MKPAVSHHVLPTPLNRAALMDAYRHAANRRLFLDYDGTLVGFVERPDDAAPPAGLLHSLKRLAGVPQNVVMVISGRGRNDLEQWLGHLPGLWLAAEHGAFVRPPGSTWESPGVPDLAWKKRIRPILNEFAARTPGSFVEEKEYCLVWHFRNADPQIAEPRSHELMVRVEGALFGSAIRTLAGHKIVEVKPTALHKGTVVDLIIRQFGTAGFWFAAGDDRTDEDLFAAMPPDSWTVRVGAGDSRARFALAGSVQINALLSDLSMTPTCGSTDSE